MRDIIITVFASTGFWASLTAIFQTIMSKKSSERKALMCILHDRIIFLAEQSIKRGYITLDEYTNLMEMFESYKSLGGNGTAEKIIGRVEHLTIKEDE